MFAVPPQEYLVLSFSFSLTRSTTTSFSSPCPLRVLLFSRISPETFYFCRDFVRLVGWSTTPSPLDGERQFFFGHSVALVSVTKITFTKVNCVFNTKLQCIANVNLMYFDTAENV